MTRPQHLARLSVCLMILTATGSGAPARTPTLEELIPERPTYTTAEELRETCEPFLKPIDSHLGRVPLYDEHLLFIVPYLGSDDAQLRDAAADILARLMKFNRPIRASAFQQYLSRDCPLNVRVVALAFSFRGFFGGGETTDYREQAKMREKWKPAWTEAINDIAGQPVAAPHLDALAFAMLFSSSCATLIEPENRPLTVRRLLAVMSRESGQHRRIIMGVIARFPLEPVASEALSWYAIEPDADARATFVERIKVVSHGAKPDELKMLKPILELAAQDPDPDIARRAKESLERANAFLKEHETRFKKPDE